MVLQGNIVDILGKRIYKGEVCVENGVITQIRPVNHTIENFILPGFVDAHIHIESSMLGLPSLQKLQCYTVLLQPFQIPMKLPMFWE